MLKTKRNPRSSVKVSTKLVAVKRLYKRTVEQTTIWKHGEKSYTLSFSTRSRHRGQGMALDFDAKDADVFVWYLATALGYECAGLPSGDHTLRIGMRTPNGMFSIVFLRDGSLSFIYLSRRSAQRLLEALAKDLDWELTG